MDFGLAKEIGEQAAEMTQSGQIMGTPAYMAPEQAAGDIKTFREEVRKTLMHELGHYLGLDEDDLIERGLE